MLRRIWPILLLLAVPALADTTATKPGKGMQLNTLEAREQQLGRAFARSAEFKEVSHTTIPRCEDVRPPQALATPDPLWAPQAKGTNVTVSFIIGRDGRVHSPLILQSAGAAGDRHVLQTVRTWRYRPGTCNGVPTETEGKIEFSSR